MKAWMVETYSSEYCVWVWAESRNRAKAIGGAELMDMNQYDGHWPDLIARREPRLDDPEVQATTKIPVATCFLAGFAWSCTTHTDSFASIDDGGELIDGKPYCSECVQELRAAS